MARQISVIQQGLLDSIAADATLGPALTSTSKRAIFRLLTFIVAAAIGILEQLIDVFKADIELTVSKATPGTAPWLQNLILLFQYSASVPQIIQLVNFVPVYPVVDSTLRIITRCSVKTDLSGNVKIKVAKSSPPVALAVGELSALQSYINTIGTVGITYIASSGTSDKLYLAADVYYKGQNSAVIQTNVIAAINNFLALLPFDGSMKISDLETTIRAVSGVTDVVLKNVAARADAVALGSATYLIQNNLVISRLWNTISGYMVGETTALNTFTDTLNFIPE